MKGGVELEEKVGRPLKFKNAAELEKVISKYFKDCDKRGKPYTMSGLARALKIDRKTLYNYGEREEFFLTIREAKANIEAYLEEGGLDGTLNSNFTQFNLKNNFGWQDKTQTELTTGEDGFSINVNLIE